MHPRQLAVCFSPQLLHNLIELSFLSLGQFTVLGASLQTTQMDFRVQYVLVWLYSWQLVRCTGCLRLCGSSTVL